MSLLTTVGSLLGSVISGNNKNGEPTGLASIIKEKSGKISFRRSAAILVLTGIVLPDVSNNGLTWMNVALTVGVLVAVSLDKIFGK